MFHEAGLSRDKHLPAVVRPRPVFSGSTYSIRAISWLNSRTIKQEADAACGLALALAEGIHQLLELGGALDLEKDLVVVVGDFDIEVLGLRGLVLLWGWRSASILLGSGHCG